jgi:hypothetical protein
MAPNHRLCERLKVKRPQEERSMRKTQLSAFIVAALVLAACEPTPPTAAPLAALSSEICGGTDRTCDFDGTWTMNVNLDNDPVDYVFACPGSITLTDHLNGQTFEGTWLIEDLSDCSGGSPVSGEVFAGLIRDDGGVEFFMEVPPLEGAVKDEDDIWEDIFGGAGIFGNNAFSGCTIRDADNQMNGALLGSDLAASASAALNCEDEFFIVGDQILVVEALIRIQVRFEGDR